MVAIRALPFLLLFPGYFAYHWSAINRWTPLYIGGYVNEVSLLIIVGMIFAISAHALFMNRIRISWCFVDTAFSIFMLWFLAIVVVHAVNLTSPEVTNNHIASLIQLAAAYIALRIFPYQGGKWLLLACAAGFSLMVLQSAEQDLLGLLFQSYQGAGYTTYQGLARSYLITSAFGLIFVKFFLVRWAGYALVTFVLFLLGARSEIVGAIIMFAIFEIAMSRKPRQALAITVSVIGILSLILFSLIDWLEYLYPDNRLLTLLLRQEADGSLQERAIQHALAWDAILAKPILGDYAHYAKELSAGAYAHSWISAWVDLGIMGLLLFLLLYVVLFRFALVLYQASIDSKQTTMRQYCSMGLGLLLMTVTFSIFAKTFTDPSIAMVAGLFAGMYLNLTRHTSQGSLRAASREG